MCVFIILHFLHKKNNKNMASFNLNLFTCHGKEKKCNALMSLSADDRFESGRLHWKPSVQCYWMVYSAGLWSAHSEEAVRIRLFLKKELWRAADTSCAVIDKTNSPCTFFGLFSQTPMAQTTPFPWRISPWITSCRYTIQPASSSNNTTYSS